MGDLQKFLRSLDPPKASMFAFNSCQDRKTIVGYCPPTRQGLNVVPTGDPNMGPGKYNFLKETSFVYQSKKKIASNIGYCHRTAPKIPRYYDPYWHRPHAYVGIKFDPVKENRYPFGKSAAAKRGLDEPKIIPPGPGTYNLEVKKLQPIKQSKFGGKPSFVPPVTLECTPVNKDKCKRCATSPIGIYFKVGKAVLCRPCYRKLCIDADPDQLKILKRYQKTRDCSFFHDHEGPFNPATWKCTPSDVKRLQHLEIYFNQYF